MEPIAIGIIAVGAISVVGYGLFRWRYPDVEVPDFVLEVFEDGTVILKHNAERTATPLDDIMAEVAQRIVEELKRDS